MKRIGIYLVLLSSVAVVATGCCLHKKACCNKNATAEASGPVKFANITDSVSYIIGTDIARNMKKSNVEINPKLMAVGMEAFFAGKDTLINEATKQAVMTKFNQDLQKKKESKDKGEVSENTQKGTLFLAKNKNQPGVVELPSGLQYKVIKEGYGVSPTITDTVKVHYTGKLIDGKVFDSSVERGEPITFPLNQVIKGWQEGVALMKTGAKYEFYIPAHLGYGDKAAGQIPAASTLIFEVELIDVNPK